MSLEGVGIGGFPPSTVLEGSGTIVSRLYASLQHGFKSLLTCVSEP